MTLILTLTPELEQRLAQEAEQQGISLDQYALQLLERTLPSKDRRAKLVALIQSWIDDGDAAEHKATGDYLIQALDQDRLSDRELFPPELEGKTW